MSVKTYNVLDDNGAVINTIMADQTFMDANHAGKYALVTSSAPTPPKAWDAFSFYRKLPASVRIAVRALAATDPIAADFMHTLDNAIASGVQVVATDPDLVAALAYLQANPSGAPCMTSAQAAALIA